MGSYAPRVVDTDLRRRLGSVGAVIIEGPKACGKTATALQVAASVLRVDTDPRVPATMTVDPSLLLEGTPPLLVDEWQEQPDLWNHVRRAVDDRALPGQFILTGSATPRDDAARHSGAGRFGRIRMRPMSLLETGHSSGASSLAGLAEGTTPRVVGPDLDLPSLVTRVCVGGWPGLQDAPTDDAMEVLRDYVDSVHQVDVPRVAGGRRDPRRVERLLASLARNVATEVGVTTLAREAGDVGMPLSRNTVDDYLDVLQRLMIVEDQPAWSTHLRSSATLRRASKRHLVDPSLAVAALRSTRTGLLHDLEALGLLFESLVIRDLRVYSQAIGGRVSHYRDSSGLEVDAIVSLPDGRWGGVEIKLGAGAIDAAAASLARFRDTVDTRRVGEPAFLAVVTPSGLGYRRGDGISVVPITSLGP